MWWTEPGYKPRAKHSYLPTIPPSMRCECGLLNVEHLSELVRMGIIPEGMDHIPYASSLAKEIANYCKFATAVG